MPRFSLLLLLALSAPAVVAAPTPDRRVVVVVWDGMRPDFVSPQTTPELWSLARAGVFFANHHPVYPSSTEVNGVALATGAYPGRSTVVGNKEYRPEIEPDKPVGIELPAVVRRGDAVSGGHYLAVATLAEFLRAHGRRTAIAGAKQVALLADRAARTDRPSAMPVVFEGAALPEALTPALAAGLGGFPPVGRNPDGRGNKLDRDAWTTRALLESLWKPEVPTFSLLWLAEPDYSQHETGPGSAPSLAAIWSSDARLGQVLAELDRRGLRDRTDVLVVSDHGFSTILRSVDVAADLSAAGFNAVRVVPGGLRSGQVLVVSNGGTDFLYVGGHDPALVRRLIQSVQTQSWAGVVFARERTDGAFTLAQAHLDARTAPDVVVALRWNGGRSATGATGLICSDSSDRGPGQGNHATLSASDMHNTLVAAGPDFRAGVRDPMPTANTDLAPTILWILGYRDAARQADGRVLGEALTIDAPPVRASPLRHLTARRDLGNGQSWSQYLNVSTVNGVDYFDEGNGDQTPAR
jgi:arylsulfatase A-like enzyme